MSEPSAFDAFVAECERLMKMLREAPSSAHREPAYWKIWIELLLGLNRIEAALERADRERVSQINKANARKKGRTRGATPSTQLKIRGLKCVLRDDENGISSAALCDRLDADRRLTYDDDDIELSLNPGHILIRDLSAGADPVETTIAVDSLRKYLRDARQALEEEKQV